ncbi:MAG: hypothetical protein WC657_09520 [Candidatus Paceibacterota bacterium]|jgi:hypothetical protein
MNRRITFAAATVALFSSALFAGDSITTLAEPITNRLFYTSCFATNVVISSAVLSVDDVVTQLREQGDITNLVKKLIETGDVCAAVGHKWGSIPHVTLEYRPDGDYPAHRKCALCGKVETKEPGAWK